MAINKVWQFNKGEWTEAFVFLKLLADGRIYGAKEDLTKDESVFVDIINILRYEKEGLLKFERDLCGGDVTASVDDAVFKIICRGELNEKAEYLYNAIKGFKGGDGKMSVPDIQDYLSDLKFSSPKVPSLPKEAAEKYGAKTDIIITTEDSADRARSTEGFSIKSHLGNPSSLFNSTTGSGITYEVVGCNDDLMHKVNSVKSETGLIQEVKNLGMELRMLGAKTEAFQDNLEFIELTMLDVISCAILIQCGYHDKAASSDTKDIVAKLAEMNPIGVKKPDKWYEAKFKELLFASFSGMTAVKPWDGKKKISGGYIDVSKSGELLYYRAVSDDVFVKYLFENTFIDRPSRGVMKDEAFTAATAYIDGRKASKQELYDATHKANGKLKDKKGDWGYIYKEQGVYKLNINFQIRFK